MAKDTERSNVAVEKGLHTKMAEIASLLGKGIREACDEAVNDWNEKHSPAAAKRAAQKAKQLLAA